MPLPGDATVRKVRPRPILLDIDDYPLREYVGSMAGELARIARGDGDPLLAQALELAAGMATRPPRRP